MASYFLKQMDELKLRVLKMAALTERALDSSLTAFLRRDGELAESVLENDQYINAMECEIDDRCLKLLALEQPVALDLRSIVASMRLCVDLERIGDESANVAELVVTLARLPLTEPHPMMEEMTKLCRDMFAKAVASFRDRDEQLAMQVIAMDDQADTLNMRILQDCMQTMVCEHKQIQRAIYRIMISRAMERICDLCTNIAESAVFLHRGVSIKHAGHKG